MEIRVFPNTETRNKSKFGKDNYRNFNEESVHQPLEISAANGNVLNTEKDKKRENDENGKKDTAKCTSKNTALWQKSAEEV